MDTTALIHQFPNMNAFENVQSAADQEYTLIRIFLGRLSDVHIIGGLTKFLFNSGVITLL